MSLEQIFFELIQVVLGTRVCLSHTPSADEWGELYALAKKQSLVGICFAAVQRLPEDMRPPELQYLTWMGMAAKIQQRNEVVNRQCVELQQLLLKDGFRTTILKGQGVGALYGENLSVLRQSGDIDLWIQGGMQKVYAYCKEKYGRFEWDYINAHLPVYSGPLTGSGEPTEVELHWRVHSLPNPFANKRLQRWFAEHEEELLNGTSELKGSGSVTVPSNEFNVFFILLHCYHHMFESGLGLRQLMDYYFVLCTSYENDNENIMELYEQFGMMRFAKGVMWIMQHVFGLDDKCLLCEPDEKEGSFLLNEIMLCGNFGHLDERKHKIKNKMVAPFATRIQHNWHLVTHYPSEFFWSPVWLVCHYVWKRNWIKKNR